MNAWPPKHWNDSGKNKSTRHKDVTRWHTFTHKMTHVQTQDGTHSHTRWHMFTHKMTHVYTQDGTRSHTRWHAFTHKTTHVHTQEDTCSHTNAVLFLYSNNQFMSLQILLFLYVINKQSTGSFNLSYFLSHIMSFSIKHYEISSVHVIY
jgi:hypothetical protein